MVPFPRLGGKRPISTNGSVGGASPAWSRDGRELYFFSEDGKIMAVAIAPGATFHAGVPKPLFDVRMNRGNANIEVSKEGHFFLPVLPERTEAPISVVLNWPALLKN